MPITPAIIFGILSKRVNMKGAVASVAVGIVLATIFVTDQLMGPEAAAKVFPFLHHDLTLNYSYRGLWGTIIVVADPVRRLLPHAAAKTGANGHHDGQLGREMGVVPRESPTGGCTWPCWSSVTVLCYWWLW